MLLLLLRQASDTVFSQCALTQYGAIPASRSVDARRMPMPLCRESLPDRRMGAQAEIDSTPGPWLQHLTLHCLFSILRHGLSKTISLSRP